MYYKFILLFLFCSNSLLAVELPSKQYFEKYCHDCHADGVDKGGVDFDTLKSSDHTKWRKIWDVIEKEQMPPVKKKQPTSKQREEMLVALEKSIFKVDRKKKYAHPIELYRLSTTQFANSLSYNLSYWNNVEKLIPPDATSMGFDNIGNIMNITPLHFESYKKIAIEVSRALFKKDSPNKTARNLGNKLLKELGDASPSSLKKLISKITLQAFRRPAKAKELEQLTNLFKTINKQSNKRDALMEVTRTVIMHPSHVFRTELFNTSKTYGNYAQLDDYALLSRISFFLWNAPPEPHMYEWARKKEVRKMLPKIVQDMIKSGKFKHFGTSFGQQWLHIKNIAYKTNSNERKGIYDKMKRETTYFLAYLFRENKPITEIFTSRETFVDKKLAEFYKLPAPKKGGFHKITLPPKTKRVGILTHPSILISTSDPDRTSPVKRGLFLLESILGMPPPPAPANVPAIEEAKKKNNQKKLSFKELLAIHRADKKCASCHDAMDPLGLAMENFDKYGNWRDTDKHGKITFSETWRGHKINNFQDMQNLIAKHYKHKFLKCLTEKLFIYGLSRGLEVSDRIAVMKIVNKLNHPKATFQDLILEIIKSTAFQYRRIGAKDDS